MGEPYVKRDVGPATARENQLLKELNALVEEMKRANIRSTMRQARMKAVITELESLGQLADAEQRAPVAAKDGR